jgi:DNA-binding MarR family transcriptional regulator
MKNQKITAKSRQKSASESAREPRGANQIDRRIYDEAGRSVAWHIRDLHRLYTAALEPLVSREGVTVGHWYYLRILSEQDGLIQQDLSRRVGIHPNTAVPALVNMEKHDLVRRMRSPEDRRRSRVYLTSKGRRLRDEMQPRVREMVYKSVAGLSQEELDTLFAVLEKMTANLRAQLPKHAEGIES